MISKSLTHFLWIYFWLFQLLSVFLVHFLKLLFTWTFYCIFYNIWKCHPVTNVYSLTGLIFDVHKYFRLILVITFCTYYEKYIFHFFFYFISLKYWNCFLLQNRYMHLCISFMESQFTPCKVRTPSASFT